jgi:hypothetical protein
MAAANSPTLIEPDRLSSFSTSASADSETVGMEATRQQRLVLNRMIRISTILASQYASILHPKPIVRRKLLTSFVLTH